MRRAAILAAAVLAVAGDGGAAGGVAELEPAEVERILRHGPGPPALRPDPSNRVSGNPRAVDFGAHLFFDPRLSTDGRVSCSTCHDPKHGWSDGRRIAQGTETGTRNAQSVLDARFNRWFGWAGGADSLWAASIRPLLDPREMGGAERHVARLVRSERDFACGYRGAFGHAPPGDDESLIADIGKALAAFQETLVSAQTAFDRFRDALSRDDRREMAQYPQAARRGLRLFVGKAGCSDCHVGPTFSNGEFDKVGIAVRDTRGRYDWGRYDGIKAVQASRFNLLSRHNDDRSKGTATSLRHVALTTEAYGAFKVPSLRGLAATAPYMHDGSLATLADVVAHYSEIDEVKLHIAAHHPHAELGDELPPRPSQVLPRTLRLSAAEQRDLVAFLESLSAPPRPIGRLAGSAAMNCE